MNELDEALNAIEAARLSQAVKEKVAGFWANLKNTLVKTNMGAEIGGSMAGAAAGAAVTALGVGAISGIRGAADSVFKARHYKNMLGEVPGLRKKRDARKTQSAFNTLWNLNRGIAKDPLAAGSFVERSMNQAELSDSAGIYVDPQTSTMLQKAAPRPYRPVQDAWGTGATKGLGVREKKEMILEKRPEQFHQKADLALYREQMRRARKQPESVGRRSGLEPPKRR